MQLRPFVNEGVTVRWTRSSPVNTEEQAIIRSLSCYVHLPRHHYHHHHPSSSASSSSRDRYGKFMDTCKGVCTRVCVCVICLFVLICKLIRRRESLAFSRYARSLVSEIVLQHALRARYTLLANILLCAFLFVERSLSVSFFVD